MSQVFRRYFVATLAVVSVLLLAYALYRLRYVALVFAIAGLLAYFLAWPIEHLSRRWSRAAAVWTVFAAFFVALLALFGALVPILTGQVQDLIQTVPELISRLEASAMEWRWQVWPGRELAIADYLANVGQDLEQRMPELLGNALDFTQSFVSGTAAVVAAILIIPLLTLYLLLDSQRLRRALIGCFVPRLQGEVDRALTAVNKSLGSYIYSRVLLALFVGVATTVMLALVGVDFALLLGLLAFAGEFIPVIGPWLAFVPAALIVLATDPYKIIVVALFYIAIQLFENYWLAPRWMGGTMDLHPLTVIIAMLVGGTIGGIGGLLVAVPAAAATKVVFNVFVFRREEPGIQVPKLDFISGERNVDYREENLNKNEPSVGSRPPGSKK